MRRRHFHALGCALAASLAASGSLRAQERTVKLMVGFPPGGSADALARILAEKIRVALGQPVVVDYKPGATGRVVLMDLKRAAPDGLTLALNPSGTFVSQPWIFSNLGYDPVKDFTPVARVASYDFAITAGPAVPAGDLRTVLAWLKANPEKATFGTPGAGSMAHFTGIMLGQATGVLFTHVPYKGGAPAAHDLVSGQIALMIDTATETLEFHRAGRARILAVTGEQPMRGLAVPTLRQAGVDLSAGGFFGLYGPAGLPRDILARLENGTAEALRQVDVQEKIYSLSLTPAFLNAAQLTALQAEDYQKWERPIKASGFKAD